MSGDILITCANETDREIIKGILERSAYKVALDGHVESLDGSGNGIKFTYGADTKIDVGASIVASVREAGLHNVVVGGKLIS